MIRASQTTTAVSSLPLGSTVHSEVHNWVRFAGKHQKHNWKQGLCSQLALPAPQMPRGTQRTSQPLNAFFPIDYEFWEGGVQTDLGLDTGIPSAKQSAQHITGTEYMLLSSTWIWWPELAEDMWWILKQAGGGPGKGKWFTFLNY